jgi:2-phospho-L-lactate guanylyltransferase (CobY/MobA/RfbA family)
VRAEIEDVKKFALAMDVALAEDLLEVRTHSVHRQPEGVSSLVDRATLEEVRGNGGLGARETVEIAQELVGD